jgi:glycine/D-amino acid oxidase-like deaminating enzyme
MVVNASGTRGARVAAMAGIAIPIEPRKRFNWVIQAETPLDRPLPLTIDPSGAFVREVGGGTYMAGGHADFDPAVAFDDFAMDQDLWLDKIWPAIATRIPAFEAVKVVSEWAGQYDYNVLDQNAITGPHPAVANFLFLNGFSGHGLQQSPAMGRATAEWIVHGGYRSLDLSKFHFQRIAEGRALVEAAII